LLGLLGVFFFGFSIPALNHLKKKVIEYAKSKGDLTPTKVKHEISYHNTSVTKVLLSFIAFAQTVAGVLLMLVWMTYNGWVILFGLIGLSTGYFVFESKHDGVENLHRFVALKTSETPRSSTELQLQGF